MKYQIIKCSTIKTLQSEIDASLNMGYKLQGGVSVITLLGETYYLQAITKE